MAMTAQVDHLVVMAATLAQGVQWCEATLGITPGPGGQHALMGTHNRLFTIASQRYPQAYFEIIAIDPTAPAPARRRWFDMDDPLLREQLVRGGPQLVHFAASVPDAQASVAALAAQDIDRGAVLQASRPTARGLLQWQITVRDDGQRLFNGCLPTLIQWGDVHPTQDMPDSGVTLQELQIDHPQVEVLDAAYHAIELHGVTIKEGPASLLARMLTPRGLVEIHS
jgi:pimeloyl-ACP methyl ester carboxylesterase